jgi:flagellar basal-body rod modification protein FlgD
MIINSISGENNASSPSTSPAAAGSSERDMFMTLLVAQLKNQDPLAPQDGAQFVAQLAQFNSLDQLVNIRQSMDQLVAAMQQQGQEPTASAQTK